MHRGHVKDPQVVRINAQYLTKVRFIIKLWFWHVKPHNSIIHPFHLNPL